MTKWFHKVKLDWLRARQDYLTATDIKDLLPVTKTGRKRKIDDYDYLKVWARKLTRLTEADCVSNGAAARGHILEPYAIETFNTNCTGSKLKHWDDALVCKIGNHNHLAFSPDATDIDQPKDGIILVNPFITEIGEVKSYSPEKHVVCGCTPKEELEERWQIATAMAVCDTIERANLIFYNPSMVNEMYIVTYTRDDLDKEMDIILEIEESWLEWIDSGTGSLNNNAMLMGTGTEELQIINKIMKAEELNPEGEKSVIL